MCSNNGSAGFPELPVPFFLILTWVLSWNVTLHCIVSFEDLGIKPRELFFTHHCCCCMPRMLLGRQWHLVPARWSVALQGDPAVSLVLCVVPHTNYHCSVSGDNRVSAQAEQSISSFRCLQKGGRSGKFPVFTWRLCDSFCPAQGTPGVSLIQDTTLFLEYSSVPVASESIGIAWLCSPWRAASQSFLWAGTIEHTIL